MTVIRTKSLGAVAATLLPRPNNPIEIVWGVVQLALTILAVPICTSFNRFNISNALAPAALLDPAPPPNIDCPPTMELVGSALRLACANWIVDSAVDISCVRLLTGNFVTRTVTGSDVVFPGLVKLVPTVWRVKVKVRSVAPRFIPLTLIPSIRLIVTILEREGIVVIFWRSWDPPALAELVALELEVTVVADVFAAGDVWAKVTVDRDVNNSRTTNERE
jgi:hypothetical protein